MPLDYLLKRRAISQGIAQPEPKKETVKKIKPVSDKRKQINKEYAKLVDKMLKENKFCQIKAEGCQKIATGLHHLQKRTAKNLLIECNLIRACNSCNLWVETHSEEAMNLGFTIPRYVKLVNNN